MELNRAVAENIKRIRKSKKLSMERLAAESGVSRSMLGQIERGEANPSVAILGKLAAALKVPAEVLLENDDFVSLAQYREVDTKPVRLDGGKAVLRPNFSYDDATKLALIGDFDRVLSLSLLEKAADKRAEDAKAKTTQAAGGDYTVTGEGDPAIDALVMQRYEAKKAKNFAEADRIRDELKAQGIEIIDTKGGASWRRV